MGLRNLFGEPVLSICSCGSFASVGSIVNGWAGYCLGSCCTLVLFTRFASGCVEAAGLRGQDSFRHSKQRHVAAHVNATVRPMIRPRSRSPAGWDMAREYGPSANASAAGWTPATRRQLGLQITPPLCLCNTLARICQRWSNLAA